MGFKCGIVGLPNVGKSTLFNALTETAAAQAANYPFCTIEPNVGEVAVPDPRLEKLAVLGKSAQIIPTRLTFVDIAGLVRGASKGEGLGNQFLANIREVDAIAHVVRCFEDGEITHVEGKIDPIADIEIIETELMLADLESLEKRVDNLTKKARGNDKEAKELLDLVNRSLELLREGKPLHVTAVIADSSSPQAGTATPEGIHKAFEGATLVDAPDGGGALVKAVEPGSPAAQVGLRNNDIIVGANRGKVSTVQQLKERAKTSAVLVLEVRRSNAIVLIPLR